MIVCGIDPGPIESAYVLWDGERIRKFGNIKNADLLSAMRTRAGREGIFGILDGIAGGIDILAIEQIRGFGVMASDALFDTCCFSGMLCEAFGEHRTAWIPRKKAAAHICGVGGISKDQFVREALIARFGGKDKAIGKKSNPGPLYGITGHLLPALAVALTYFDTTETVVQSSQGDGW